MRAGLGKRGGRIEEHDHDHDDGRRIPSTVAVQL